jgi:hypothetical protein
MQQHSGSTEVDRFLARHLNPAPGRTTHSSKERILHWLEVANTPAAYALDPSAKSIANMRRKARQNVRRLVERHPDAAALIDATLQTRVTR